MDGTKVVLIQETAGSTKSVLWDLRLLQEIRPTSHLTKNDTMMTMTNPPPNTLNSQELFLIPTLSQQSTMLHIRNL
jgi:hypothetical protein